MKPLMGLALGSIPRILFEENKINKALMRQLDDLWTAGFPHSIIEQVEALGFMLENRTNGPLPKFDYFNIYTNTTARPDCKSIW